LNWPEYDTDEDGVQDNDMVYTHVLSRSGKDVRSPLDNLRSSDVKVSYTEPYIHSSATDARKETIR